MATKKYSDPSLVSAAPLDGTERWGVTDAGVSKYQTNADIFTYIQTLTGNLLAVARTGVRKNSTGSTFERRRHNFIEGTGMGITIADDSGSEEVDITLTPTNVMTTAGDMIKGGASGVQTRHAIGTERQALTVVSGAPAWAGPFGLLARYRNSAGITLPTGVVTRPNFNTSDYDPSSLVTVGASWVFTAPVTAWYDIRLVNGYIDGNGAVYNEGDGVSVSLRKNAGTENDIAYIELDATTSTSHWLYLHGTYSISLAATDTIHLRFDNFSASDRILGAGAAIEVHRVT